MNQSLKAALLSALIFPGVGQIVSGYIKKGWSFVIVMLLLLGILILKIMQQASMVLEEMQKKGTPIDVDEISKLSSDMISFSDNMFLNTVFIALILTWLFSIIDAYKSGNNN